MGAKKYFFFLSGQLGLMLLARYFFQWILLFAGQTVQTPAGAVVLFSPAAVGAVLLGFRIFDAVTDPIAGVWSDSWVRAGKERRSLVLFWFAVPAAGLILCFAPDFDTSAALRWSLLLAGMIVFFIGYTFYGIPYWSLVQDYGRGNSERKRQLSNLIGAGLMLATALGFILTPGMVKHLGFFNSAIILGAIGTCLMLLPYFAAPHDVGRRDSHGAETENPPLGLKDVLASLRHRRFSALCALYVGSQMSLTIMTSAAPFIAVRLLGGTEADVAMLMGPLLLFALVTFLLVPRISRKLGWEKTSVRASILLGLVYLFGSLIGKPLLGSAFVTAMIVFAAAGPMIALLLGVESEAITDCANERGTNLVSCYFGVFNLVVKGFNGLAIFGAGILVELSMGSWGTAAIQGMLLAAGITLFAGLFAYWLLSRQPQSR